MNIIFRHNIDFLYHSRSNNDFESDAIDNETSKMMCGNGNTRNIASYNVYVYILCIIANITIYRYISIFLLVYVLTSQ